MENNTRLKKICEIYSVEILEEGVELNEGYQYEVSGSLPQLADSIAKMAVEFDNNNDMLGESAGSIFIGLIVEYFISYTIYLIAKRRIMKKGERGSNKLASSGE